MEILTIKELGASLANSKLKLISDLAISKNKIACTYRNRL
jgi:hypothetical protein